MGRAVIVDVIEPKKLNFALSAATTTQLTRAVVNQCIEPILPKTRLAVLVVARLAPGV
jgi:hypothetical protein